MQTAQNILRRHVVAFALIIQVCPAAFAYSARVNRVGDFSSSFTRVGVLPATCAPSVDCVWVENLVAGKLVAAGIPIVPPAVVSQVMFDLGIAELTDENRRALAAKLGVDAFVAPAVDAVATENTGSVAVLFTGGIFTSAPRERHVGSVQLVIVAADSGRVLMQGAAYGQSRFVSKRGMVAKTFGEIVSRAFPPGFKLTKKE